MAEVASLCVNQDKCRLGKILYIVYMKATHMCV